MSVVYEAPTKTMKCVSCKKDVLVQVKDGRYEPVEMPGIWRRWSGPQCAKCVEEGRDY